MTKRAACIAVCSALAVVASIALDGCGIFDAIWWQSTITDQQFCDQLNAVASQAATCRHTIAQPTCKSVDDVSCVRQEVASGCHDDEYEKLLDCLFKQPHQCRELPPVDDNAGEGEGEGEGEGGDATANGFCAPELAALSTCAHLDNGCSSNVGVGGGACNGDGICQSTEDQTNCQDCCNQDTFCQPNESSLCRDCSGEGSCAGFTCPPDDHCVVEGATPTCVPNGSGSCDRDGRCGPGEDNASCSFDCDACTNDGVCGERESADCPGCAGCVNDGVCDGSEQTSCADCRCDHDGECNHQETNASCPSDCTACVVNSQCDAHESHVDCSDCTGAGGCNHNSICEQGEAPATCDDCTSLASFGGCDLDDVCQATESYRCGDCLEAPPSLLHTTTCASPADCSGATNCTGANEVFCNVGATSECNERAPTTNVCWPACNKTTPCPLDNTAGRGLGCFTLLDAANPGAGACEPGECHAQNAPGGECDGGTLCIDPLELKSGGGGAVNEPLDGLCAATCAPLQCLTGACDCVGLPRCAPVRSGAGNVINYACVPPGPVAAGGVCVVESDCAPNTTCAGGHCVAMTPCTTDAKCPAATPTCGPQGVCQ